MEKTVKGATKVKLAAPKAKYVEAIVAAANNGSEIAIAEVFRTLQLRLRDSTWTIVFKALIITHLMIRESRPDTTLRYIAESPRRLAIGDFTELRTQGTNIRRYHEYLLEKARGYRDTQTDYVKSGSARPKSLSVEKGLLRETETVQEQISALLRCNMLGDHDPDNELTLTAFRLLTLDLLELFKCMNEGTISVLEQYFEMSRPDAERGLNIYKTFNKQTSQVVQYLAIARQYEGSTRLEVPHLKHAPTSLVSSLEEYLTDPEFENNRRQYLAQLKGPGKAFSKPSFKPNTATSGNATPKSTDTSKPEKASKASDIAPAQNSSSTAAKGPAPDLIDFFDSIEQNQEPMAQPGVVPAPFATGQPQAQHYQPQAWQQTGYQTQQAFLPQQTGFSNAASYFNSGPESQQQQQVQPLQPDFTGAGFGGYTAQPQQQQQQPSPAPHLNIQPTPSNGPQSTSSLFDQQQQQQQYLQSAPPLQPQHTATNPFRQSMMPANISSSYTNPATSLSRQATNPFAKNLSQQPPQSFPSSSPPDSFVPINSSFASSPAPYSFPQSTGAAITSQPTSASTPAAGPFPDQSQPQTQQQELQQSSIFFSPSSSNPVSLPSQPSQTNAIQPSSTGLTSQKTGTNPFARNKSPQLLATPTGTTNPFRKSQLGGLNPGSTTSPLATSYTGTEGGAVAAAAGGGGGGGGGGGSSGTFGGYDINNVPTVPIFPR